MINWYQWRVLADRSLESLLSDRRRLARALLLPIVLGAVLLLLTLYAGISTERTARLLGLAAMSLGLFQALHDTHVERAFVRGELRSAHLDVGAYLLARLRVGGLIHTAQLAIMLALLGLGPPLPAPIGWRALVLLAVATCSAPLGILIAARIPSRFAWGVALLTLLLSSLLAEILPGWGVTPHGAGGAALMGFARDLSDPFAALAALWPLLPMGGLSLLAARSMLSRSV